MLQNQYRRKIRYRYYHYHRTSSDEYAGIRVAFHVGRPFLYDQVVRIFLP